MKNEIQAVHPEASATALIIDDHWMVARFLADFCSTRFGICILGIFGTGADAIRAMHSTRPNLVFLDLNLPDMSGFDVAYEAHFVEPRPRIIGVSGSCTRFAVSLCNRLRLDGFIDKSFNINDLNPHEIDALIRGPGYFSASYKSHLNLLRSDPNSFEKIVSDRELLILAMVAAHLTDEEIGIQLRISPKTVETHRKNISGKYGFHNKDDLKRYAGSQGISLKLMPKYLIFGERRTYFDV